MKNTDQVLQILSDLRTQLKKGRRAYWKSHTAQDYDEAENISMANMALVAKIEVIEMILTE